MAAKKPSAADRTVDMFASPKPIDDRPIEILENDEKAERVPMELAADESRDSAFRVQEWTTMAFGMPDAPGNEYRVSRKGQHFYVETLGKEPGATCSRYVGLMVHERDLFNMVAVLVKAVREKQARDAKL